MTLAELYSNRSILQMMLMLNCFELKSVSFRKPILFEYNMSIPGCFHQNISVTLYFIVLEI